MRGHRRFSCAAMLMALGVSVPAFADDHGHHHGHDGAVVVTEVRGALPVRDVVVRDVQVRPVVVRPVGPRPAVAPRPEVPRPFLPDVISRPQQSAYPQANYPQSNYPQSSHRYTNGYSGRGRRSYYVFSSRFNIGTGLLVGYPVAYPYPYAYPFLYDSSPYPAYPDPGYQAPSPSPSMSASPGNTYSNMGGVTPAPPLSTPIDCGVDPNASTPCGGVSFDVFPGDAQVSVEGVFVGTVDRFSSTRPPLVLAPGRHYFELRLPGYQSVVFEADVNAGEVIPYQGTLEPLRTR
jgi:hypothetical protein